VRLGPVPVVISDSGISERLRKRTGDPSAWVFGFDGHELYCLFIPGQGTWAFDAATQQWSEMASPDKIGWDAHVGYENQGLVVAGSAVDGQTWYVDPSAGNDSGTAFERIVTATVSIMGQLPRNDSLTVGIGCSADCTVRVRWKDGQDDFPSYYDELEARAPLDVVNMCRLGMPDEPFRTFEISVIDDVRISIAGAKVNEGWS